MTAPNGSKVIVLYLNCLGEVIKYLLPLSERFCRQFKIVPLIFNDSDIGAKLDSIEPHLQCCDFLAYHSAPWLLGLGDNYEKYETFFQQLPPHIVKITVPHPQFHAFWPFHADEPRSREPRQPDRHGFVRDYWHGDSFVLNLLKEECPPEEIIARYLSLNIAEHVDLDRLLKMSLGRLERNEKSDTVKISHLISDRFAAEPFFRNVNHANNRLLLYIANGILKEIDCDQIPYSALSRINEILPESVPIHPSVGRHFKLPWVDERTRYVVDRDRIRYLTFSEYLREYVYFAPLPDKHKKRTKPELEKTKIVHLAAPKSDPEPAEIECDFRIADLDEIVSKYLVNGCVLLRHFVNPVDLAKLNERIDELYQKIEGFHIEPKHLRDHGQPMFHESLFKQKHYDLLDRVFGSGAYRVSEVTGSRRIDPSGTAGQWMAPLGAHIDAFFHQVEFTVNFWIPFRDCGVDVPSLGLIRAPFGDIANFAEYNGRDDPDAADHGHQAGWHFNCFAPRMLPLANGDRTAFQEMCSAFSGRVWTPTYTFGDAMMLSNWTMHFTHSVPGMQARRSNVELRFMSDQTLTEIVERHCQPGEGE